MNNSKNYLQDPTYEDFIQALMNSIRLSMLLISDILTRNHDVSGTIDGMLQPCTDKDPEAQCMPDKTGQTPQILHNQANDGQLAPDYEPDKETLDKIRNTYNGLLDCLDQMLAAGCVSTSTAETIMEICGTDAKNIVLNYRNQGDKQT